jgi:hypothetical protein
MDTPTVSPPHEGEHSLFGYARLAISMSPGNSGIKSGATSRPAGKTHLFDGEHTACGRSRGSMAVTLVPANVTERTWPVRVALCRTCMGKVTAR